ncbi:hypothetical protein ACJJIP_09930 [Microbulbifer sp. VTAC004]|uniref:hypothetical protein n=1 Tax=Microbulbifer sp. VTAC004 TaxID=3243386 RepID=UPI00403A1931
MNDKIRIVRPSGSPPGPEQAESGLTEDGDVTVVVRQDAASSNDRPPIPGINHHW